MRLATRLTTSLCEKVRLTASAKRWAPFGPRSQKPSGQHFALGALDVDTTFRSEAPKGLASASLQTDAHCKRLNLAPLEHCRRQPRHNSQFACLAKLWCEHSRGKQGAVLAASPKGDD